MKKRVIILARTVFLLAPATAGPAFDDDKLIAAIKVLMYQAPCCGSWPRLDAKQARAILAYLHGEDSADGRELWRVVGKKLLTELEKIDPQEAQRVREQARNVSHG